MARLDDLVDQVSNQTLKREMKSALAEIKRRQRFGLVFEEHIPETSALPRLPVQTGALVQRRDTWTWTGENTRCTAVFTYNGKTQTAHHERLDDDGDWAPAMEVTLSKVVG